MERFVYEPKPRLVRVTGKCDSCEYNILSITGEKQLSGVISKMQNWVSHHEVRYGHHVSFSQEISQQSNNLTRDQL